MLDELLHLSHVVAPDAPGKEVPAAWRRRGAPTFETVGVARKGAVDVVLAVAEECLAEHGGADPGCLERAVRHGPYSGPGDVSPVANGGAHRSSGLSIMMAFSRALISADGTVPCSSARLSRSRS